MTNYEEELRMVERQIENASNISHVTVCKCDIDDDFDEEIEYNDELDEEECLNDEYSGEDYKPNVFYLQTVEYFRNAGCRVNVEDGGTKLIIDASSYDEN